MPDLESSDRPDGGFREPFRAMDGLLRLVAWFVCGAALTFLAVEFSGSGPKPVKPLLGAGGFAALALMTVRNGLRTGRVRLGRETNFTSRQDNPIGFWFRIGFGSVAFLLLLLLIFAVLDPRAFQFVIRVMR